MPKQLIVLMKDHYPFGECQECNSESIKVLVRKIYQVQFEQRKTILEKLKIIRKLNNERLVKVQSIMQQQQSIHVLFQYVPIKVQTWISNINDQFIENFRDQLIKLSSFLANNSIKVDFKMNNIGMDQNYGPKYFLDLNFQSNINLNRQKLKNQYIREINNLFKPYLNHHQPSISILVENDKMQNSVQLQQPRKENNKKQENVRRSNNATSPSVNSKSREKALQRYYQEVNMSVDEESQKILQEFMNVLDNDEEQQSGPSLIQTSYHSQSVPKSPNMHNSMKYFEAQQNSSMQLSNSKEPINQIQNHSFSDAQVSHSKNNTSTSNSHSLKKSETAKLRSAANVEMEGRNKGQFLDPKQDMRESVYLQCRVKSAIEKSMMIINKYKLNKESKA